LQYRKLGTSDLQVPTVIFGAWAIGGWLWGGTDDKNAVAAMQRALDLGVNCIDTAAIYGMGHSEKLVGRAIKGRPRDSVIIATKCGLRWEGVEPKEDSFETVDNSGRAIRVIKHLAADSIAYECEQSLRRLGTDYIDLYQCHWPDVSTPIEETMGALLELRDQGKIRAIGVSNFDADQMADCLRYAPLASDQPRYGLLSRGVEDSILPFCRRHNVGVVCYSPLEHGILTGKVPAERTFPDDDLRSKLPWYQPQNRSRVNAALEEIRPIAESHNATLAQITVAWVIAQPGVTAALVGARRPEQVEENVGAADVELSADELAAIRATFEALGDPLPVEKSFKGIAQRKG